MKNDVLNQVNIIYKKEHPSFYTKITKSSLNKLSKAREDLLLKLKLPKKIFNNSTLLDLGSGSGIYGLIYNNFGAKTQLVEYEKKFSDQSKKLFKKFSKNKHYKIKNLDIFRYKTKKKYEIVTFNGVAHHTHNPDQILDNACKFLDKNGFIIYGIGNKSGFFQRAIQRLILYKISSNEEELIKNANLLFKEHLNRAKKFGGRSINQIIYDTYINPKIDCQSSEKIISIFKNNAIELYSTFPNLEYNEIFSNLKVNNYRNFNLSKNNIKNSKKVYLSEHQWLSNPENVKQIKIKRNIDKLEFLKNKIVTKLNDKNNKNFNINYKDIISSMSKYTKKTKYLNQIKFFNEGYQIKFFKEMEKLFKLLSKKDCNEHQILQFLKKTKFIFKGTVGIGMNYYVGYKK